LSIKIAEAHRKCKLCNNYRAQRYCPRTGKDICWKCCNEKRTDRKCPQECAYIIHSEKGTDFAGSLLKSKVDSMQELRGLTKNLFDLWSESPAEAFGGRIPVEMTGSEEGKRELVDYLKKIEDLAILPPGYITRKLKLSMPEGKEPENYEYASEQYILKMAAGEWEESIGYLYDSKKYNDDLFKMNYLTRRAENRLLKSITTCHLLFSAMSENREEALVYYEVNNRFDLTLIMGIAEGKWLVKEVVIGSPSFYYGEREAIILISGFISHQEMEKAEKYLQKYQEILIDSADLNYLNGLYFLLKKDYPKALKYYLTAVEIDPDFYEYKYNLALVYQMLRSFETAKRLYSELLGKKSDDTNVLNNLAVIFEAEGDKEEALRLLEKCLEFDSTNELAKKNIERITKK